MINTTPGTMTRRHSSPVLYKFDVSFADPRVYIPTRKRSSIPVMPLTPTIEAQRLPSVVESHKSSWRLSFTSPNRGHHLRNLSQDYGHPISLTSQIIGRSPVPVNKWLHGQGLRSPSKDISSSEENPQVKCTTSPSQTCLSHQDFGVDGPDDSSTTLHLHEMGISKLLASTGGRSRDSLPGILQPSTSSPQLSSLNSHKRNFSNLSEYSLKDIARHRQNTSDSMPLSERIPHTWGSIKQDGASSSYPSNGNSIQPSPQSSRFDLMALIAVSRSKRETEEKPGNPFGHFVDQKIANLTRLHSALHCNYCNTGCGGAPSES